MGTLMKTLGYCYCCILTSALVSSLRILEAGEDAGTRILPLRGADLAMEDGNMRVLRSSQNHIFNQGTLRTLKRSSPLNDYGVRKRSEQEDILRSTVHNGGFLRSLRSLPEDEDMEVMEDMDDEPV